MEKKTTDFGWRFKNSLFFILCFIPFLQWIPFFIMNGKIPKKRWLLMGFANILLLVTALAIPFLGSAYRWNNIPDKPDTEPVRVEYAGEYPSLTDYFEEDYWNIEDYTETEEYKQYEKDMDAYWKSDGYKAYQSALDEWYKTPEYKEYEKESDRVRRVSSTCESIGSTLSVVGWLVFMILGFFVERYKYLRALEVNKNRGNVYGQLANRTDMPGQPATGNSGVSQPAREPEPVQRVIQKAPAERHLDIDMDTKPSPAREQSDVFKPVTQVSHATIGTPVTPATLIDVNSATEEQLMTLTGMKTIDAKKIIDYRNSHGAFKNTDEFFDSFEAKPHMIVKMTREITVERKENPEGAYAAQTQTETVSNSGAHETKRRFDL